MPKQKWKRPNAHKHGAFSATAIFPGEDEQEFEELHAALVEEWMPVGATEEDAVLSIAKAVWRKRRVQKFLQAEFMGYAGDPTHRSYDEVIGLHAFAALMKEAPETAFQNYGKRCLRPERISHLKEKIRRSQFQSISEWAQAVINEINSLITAAINDNPEGAQVAALFHSAATVSNDLFKQELALDERLDAMIDRAVKRLIQTKAMKQMLSQTTTARLDERPTKIVGIKTSKG
jgi:cytosine/adenosine deaminase-related metal-dependent hydrolase